MFSDVRSGIDRSFSVRGQMQTVIGHTMSFHGALLHRLVADDSRLCQRVCVVGARGEESERGGSA